jgi:hypothetical protein
MLMSQDQAQDIKTKGLESLNENLPHETSSDTLHDTEIAANSPTD